MDTDKKNDCVMDVVRSTFTEMFSTYPCSLLRCIMFDTSLENSKEQFYCNFDNKIKYGYELGESSQILKYEA